MRLPAVRFTIKRMMFAMVVIAFFMGGCRVAWLASRYRLAAKNCTTLELWCRYAEHFVQGSANGQDELAFFVVGPLAEDKIARTAAARGFQHTTSYYADLRRGLRKPLRGRGPPPTLIPRRHSGNQTGGSRARLLRLDGHAAGSFREPDDPAHLPTCPTCPDRFCVRILCTPVQSHESAERDAR